MENKDIALLAGKTLVDKKGIDVVLIDIQEKAVFADYMLVATAGSDRQVEALKDYVEEALFKEGIEPKNIEGKNSGWVLMDYGDLIVNIFTEKMRDKYNIEKVWGDCTFVDKEEFN